MITFFRCLWRTHFFSKYLNPHFYLYHHRTKDVPLLSWKIRANWTRTLSSAEAPVGYPYINSNNRKNRKGAEDDGKRKKAGASLLSFPFPSCPARCLFLSPQLPHNTKRPLRRRLRWTGIYFWHKWDGRLGKQKGALLQLGEMTYLYHCNCSVLAIIRNNAHGLYAFQFNSIQFNFIIHTL